MKWAAPLGAAALLASQGLVETLAAGLFCAALIVVAAWRHEREGLA